LKQARIENIFNLVNAQLEGAFSRQANIVVKRSKLEDAVKTLRKLPLFGYVSHAVDYEYPTAEDLLKMPADKPISITLFRFKESTYSPSKRIGAIQVVYSNGQSSPVFVAQG
jgi:hypothetical protein